MNTTTKTPQIDFTRINNDVNGNPRYVCHFMEIPLTGKECEEIESNPSERLNTWYKIAVKKANTIGGRKYHNKQYGGGIVFQSHNIADTSKRIQELKNR